MTASSVPELIAWLRNRSRNAKIVLIPRRVDEPAVTTAGVLDDALVALAAAGGAPPAVADPPPESVLDDLHADLVDIAERLRNGRDVGPTPAAALPLRPGRRVLVVRTEAGATELSIEVAP